MAGITPPGVRRAATYQQERRKQTENPRYSVYSHEPVNKWLKEINSFLHSDTPLDKNTMTESMDRPSAVCAT